MRLLKFYPGGEENCGKGLEGDGLHLPGLSAHLSQTLCGASDTMAPYEVVDGDKPTCKNCILVAKDIFARYKKIDVSKW